MFDNQGKGGKNGMDADVGGEEAIAGTFIWFIMIHLMILA